MRTLLIFLAIAAGFLAGWMLRGFFSIDGCLDAGGAWDDARLVCIGIEPQSQLPADAG